MTHIITFVYLCVTKVKYENVCLRSIMSKICSHISMYTHMYDDVVNREALERYDEEYPKVYRCLHMLCPCDKFCHTI